MLIKTKCGSKKCKQQTDSFRIKKPLANASRNMLKLTLAEHAAKVLVKFTLNMGAYLCPIRFQVFALLSTFQFTLKES